MIHGEYIIETIYTRMFHQYHLEQGHENIITRQGETHILNRLINDNLGLIKYICLGNGTDSPQKSDNKLGNETNRKIPKIRVDLNEKSIIFIAEYDAIEIDGACEIGLSTDENLITHDVFNTILAPATSQTQITYRLLLDTENRKTGWSHTTGTNYTYEVLEKNTVHGVFEAETDSGYIRKNSVEEVDSTQCSYYYNTKNNKLYIRLTNTNNDPNNRKILIKTK